MDKEVIEVLIDGMTCSHCQRAVENAIAALPGVNDVRVDLQHGKATIHGFVSDEALLRAIRNEGYDANVVQASHPSV
jgi:copper chaperone